MIVREWKSFDVRLMIVIVKSEIESSVVWKEGRFREMEGSFMKAEFPTRGFMGSVEKATLEEVSGPKVRHRSLENFQMNPLNTSRPSEQWGKQGQCMHWPPTSKPDRHDCRYDARIAV